MSDPYAPQTPYGMPPPAAAAGPPVAPGVVPPPAARRGSAAVVILAVLAALLLIGEIALVVTSNRAVSDQNRALATAREQAARDTAERDAARAERDKAAAGASGLPAKLQAVKAADKAVADAIRTWTTVNSTKFGTVISAIEKCYFAVDDYDRAAAVVPADALAGQPASVDLKAADTDCGRPALAAL